MRKNGKPLNVFIVGAGMYVCGRGTSGFGTVLPTVVQASAEGSVGQIFIAATSPKSVEILRAKLDELNAKLGTQVPIQGYPRGKGANSLAYRQVLAEIPRPACAILAIPDHLHAAIAEDVIQAGLHLLVVKPLTPNLSSACALANLAMAHHVYGAVDFHKRFDEANLLLRQAVVEGRLGDIRYITVEFTQRRSVRQIFRSWIQHTNVFQYLGVHYVDMIYFVTGARPVRALATGQPLDPATSDLGSLDAIEALVEWKDQRGEKSFVSTIVTNWIDADNSSAMSDQKITVVGTSGRYQSDQKHRGVQLVTEESGVEDINPYFSQLYAGLNDSTRVHGYGPRSIRQFLTDVRDLTDGECELGELNLKRPSFQEALVSTAVVEAANRSLSQGAEWVTVDQSALELSRTVG